MHQRQDVHLNETIQSAQVEHVLQMFLIVVCFIQPIFYFELLKPNLLVQDSY